jgi:hypothetical protein
VGTYEEKWFVSMEIVCMAVANEDLSAMIWIAKWGNNNFTTAEMIQGSMINCNIRHFGSQRKYEYWETIPIFHRIMALLRLRSLSEIINLPSIFIFYTQNSYSNGIKHSKTILRQHR